MGLVEDSLAPFIGVTEDPFDHVGVDDSGADRVDADAGAGVVEGGALGGAEDSEL